MTNCPKVSVEARCPPLMTVDINGLSDVCIKALPMPRSEKEMSMMPKFSPRMGSASDIRVTMSDRSTVFLRPILFIRMPVGTEKMRNQKNTSEGNTLATESVS